MPPESRGVPLRLAASGKTSTPHASPHCDWEKSPDNNREYPALSIGIAVENEAVVSGTGIATLL